MKRNASFSKLEDDVDLGKCLKTFNEYLEREVHQNDTLQSIALEFNTTISELKQLNLIHKDNELYARRIIKIPRKARILLCEPDFFSSNHHEQQQDSIPKIKDEIVESINAVSILPSNDDDRSQNCNRNNNNTSFHVTDEHHDVDDDTPLIINPSSTSSLPELIIHRRRPCLEDIGWVPLLLVFLCITLTVPAMYLWVTWKHQQHK